MLFHTFADTAPYARRLAKISHTRCARIAVHAFPDGESLPRVRCPVERHAVVVRFLHRPNAKLFETLLAADALRRAGARSVTLLAPYLPYMRQDAVFRSGEALSQRVLGRLLAEAFDQVLTIEAHLHRTRRLAAVISPRSRSVSAAPVIAEWITRHGRDCVLIGPDEESASLVAAAAHAAHTRWAVGRKRRLADRSVRIDFSPMPEAPRALLLDDIVSSAATLTVAARTLRSQGVSIAGAIVVHALFEAGALERLRAAGVRRIVSCDTVPHPTNALRTAPLVIEALRSLSR